ncbi:TRAP transporter small permease [Pseudoroseicyclus aestuarii]|uniref:TRAP transporter small permease protein n=1 Tax=Pseudoroseicyclus aestuarii TaxID=1795041 RepID=A0A318T2Y4_9RHOB|nr:TRAP transporter small permease [Pseudoroseicyclus aestuarii]PYE84574.1 TRAP-type C4-dicarboxylate transport system permease small subunit [Pseudoroseicyclus aestuarii]
MTSLRWLADRLIGLSALIGSVALIVQVSVILVDVLGRYFGAPLRGAQDVSTMAMTVLVFGGMALCDRLGGHISVDLLEPRFPAWLNRASDIASALLGAAIFAGIAWTVYDSARLSLMLNLRSNIIDLPKAWFQWGVCAFSGLTALAMLLRAAEVASRRSPPRWDTAQEAPR